MMHIQTVLGFLVDGNGNIMLKLMRQMKRQVKGKWTKEKKKNQMAFL